jgi:hypothetical protein
VTRVRCDDLVSRIGREREESVIELQFGIASTEDALWEGGGHASAATTWSVALDASMGERNWHTILAALRDDAH